MWNRATVLASEPRRRAPRVRTLVAFSSLIMLMFCAYVAYQASKAYQTTLEDARETSQRLTNIMADQVELAFLAVDLTLRRAVERQYFHQLFGSTIPQQDMENNFRLWVDETPQIAAIMMVGAKGQVEIAAFKRGYENWYDYNEPLEQRDVFTHLRDSSDSSLYIGSTRTGNKQHPELIVVGRKLTGIDGNFRGIVMAAVDPQYFLDFFNSVDFGTHRFMTLLMKDGRVLFTGPSPYEKDVQTLDTLAGLASSAVPERETSRIDSIQDTLKAYSIKQLSHLPLYVAIVLDERDFLAGWRHARVKDVSFLAIFTIFGSVLSFFALTMAKQILRVEESESSAILASQAKSEFLANMSHELRTPLNAIIGFSEMINAGYFGQLNDKQKERIHDINLCGNHLLQLISDILEFSKGEAGKLDLNEEKVELPEIMHECVRMIQDRAKAKGVTLHVDAADGVPAIYADTRKIRQILLNLLSNAIKFTPSGGRVELSTKIDHHNQVNLTVSDTGIGIAEEEIPRALSVFGQVHRTQSHEGTGLGLPLCKMFAELHGGKLILASTQGVGTTVRVLLPESRIMKAA